MSGYCAGNGLTLTSISSGANKSQNDKMENVCCDEHYDLLIKTQSTCEGILASGRSDIWSTYGALRRATAVFCDILLQGLAIEDEEVGGTIDMAVALNNCRILVVSKELRRHQLMITKEYNS